MDWEVSGNVATRGAAGAGRGGKEGPGTLKAGENREDDGGVGGEYEA